MIVRQRKTRSSIKHVRQAYAEPSPVPREHNDCGVRAVATACCLPYLTVWQAYADNGRRPRQGVYIWQVEAVLKRLAPGAERVPTSRDWEERRNDRGTSGAAHESITLAEFLRRYPQGHYVVQRPGHVFAVIDGQVHDWGERTSGARSRVCNAWRVDIAAQDLTD